MPEPFRDALGRSRRNCPQSVGVRVSETTADTRIEALNVTANSRNKRPINPPMSNIGMNTATRERVMEIR